MEHYILREKDKKQFEQKIKPFIKNGESAYIYCSFTYITPNYSVLLFLQELYEFTKKNNLKVILVIWDMSVLANNYYRQMKKKVSDEKFIEQKIDELYNISYSLGFKEETISIYKSSDLWKRFISYEEDIYQGFYSTLVQLKVEEYALAYKAAYFIQMPLNLFFCNYFHKLFPEDVDNKIELIFFEEQKEKLYTHTRKIMHDIGITNYQSPTFVIMEEFPYLNYNEYEPEWDMSFADIHEIISNIKPSKLEAFKVYHLLGVDKPHLSKTEEETYENLAKKVYEYLKERKKEYENITGKTEEKIISIDDEERLLSIGGILRSKIALDILIKADGKKSMSKIAKEMKKSIPTISTYVKKLKKIGLVAILENGNLKRTIKGFKVNLELGMKDGF